MKQDKAYLPEIHNRKAYHDYEIKSTLECGICLSGNEVKSIRNGSANIKEAWCAIQNHNIVVRNMFIARYETANIFDVDERRERQLLAHKSEIRKLEATITEKGLTLIPLKIYFVNQKCKLLLGVCKGKHNYDKRETLKNKQVQRDIDRALKSKVR